MGMRFEDLKVWQKGIELVEQIYFLTNNFPKNEVYSLTSQIRRSATSIPSNIAEGKGRGGLKEFINFLHISLGSLYELKTQVHIARKLSYLDDSSYKQLDAKIKELDKMINALIIDRKNNL
jgi:four helix bundle protein